VDAGALSRRPLVVAFLTGAAGLGLEVVAARVAALNVGVSLYSWTGVIGAVLAGIALGSWVGGRLAMARPGPLLAATAAYAPLAVTLLSTWPVVAALEPAPRLWRLGIVLLLVGFLPAVPLGAVPPLLARAVVVAAASAGRRTGQLLAASALGSLVGALLAGLWLLPLVGVRGAALAFAAALAGAALAGRASSTPAAGTPSGWGAGGALIGLVLATALLAPHACDAESAYQCIRVADEESLDGRPVKVLYLDGLPHAHVALDDPLELVHEYLVPAAELAHYQGARAVLVIGGGGYSLPRRLAAALPEARVDVLELDPAVTRIAHERLGLPANPPFAIHHGDARQTLSALPAIAYDLIVLDAFSDVVVPYHLVTDGFDRALRARLAPDGLYAALVHDRGGDGRLLPAVARTMRSAFGRVDVLAAGPGVRWDSPRPRTWTVVGSARGVDPTRLRETRRLTRTGPFPPLSERMGDDLRDELLERDGPAILTDDYAPVELLAAPLFR
jgi:spermidine synthase